MSLTASVAEMVKDSSMEREGSLVRVPVETYRHVHVFSCWIFACVPLLTIRKAHTNKINRDIHPEKSVQRIRFKTRIEPVGEPYREVCLSPWKGNWRISKNRIDWRNVLLSEKNYFHEKELKENWGHRVIRVQWPTLWPQRSRWPLWSVWRSSWP